MSIEAMKQALDALRQAIEEAEKQEPPKKGPQKKGPRKPEWGQEYWHVGALGSAVSKIFTNALFDKELLNFGNGFSSKENSEKASKIMRIHNKILQYIIENDSDWEEDWNDRNQMKWFPWFDPYTDKWERNDTNCLKIAGCLYCSKKCCHELVELLNNGWLEEEDK